MKPTYSFLSKGRGQNQYVPIHHGPQVSTCTAGVHVYLLQCNAHSIELDHEYHHEQDVVAAILHYNN